MHGRNCRPWMRGAFLIVAASLGVGGVVAQHKNGGTSAELQQLRAEVEALKAQVAALQKGPGAPAVAAKEPEKPHVNTAALLAKLQAGNERFVSSTPAKKNFKKDRGAVAGGQHPYAIVLTCADSRVPPELIFDASVGQIFVVRDAGNIVDSVVLGSIEYAAEHLHAGMLLILGHTSCGAIGATVAGGEVPPNIGSLVSRLRVPVEEQRAKGLKDKDLAAASVEANVRYQMNQTLQQSPLLKEMVEKHELVVVGGVYDLSTGKVSFLSTGH